MHYGYCVHTHREDRRVYLKWTVVIYAVFFENNH